VSLSVPFVCTTPPSYPRSLAAGAFGATSRLLRLAAALHLHLKQVLAALPLVVQKPRQRGRHGFIYVGPSIIFTAGTKHTLKGKLGYAAKLPVLKPLSIKVPGKQTKFRKSCST
jgi:hypothetical protein